MKEDAGKVLELLFSSNTCPACQGAKPKYLITCQICWELVKAKTRRALLKPDQKVPYRIAGFLAWLSVGAKVQSIHIDSGRRVDYGPPMVLIGAAARGKLRGKRLEHIVKSSKMGRLA